MNTNQPRSGRSTRIALETIAAAMKTPGVAVPIIDHVDTREASEHLTRTITGMVDRLGLLDFELVREFGERPSSCATDFLPD